MIKLPEELKSELEARRNVPEIIRDECRPVIIRQGKTFVYSAWNIEETISRARYCNAQYPVYGPNMDDALVALEEDLRSGRAVLGMPWLFAMLLGEIKKFWPSDSEVRGVYYQVLVTSPFDYRRNPKFLISQNERASLMIDTITQGCYELPVDS